MSFSQRSKWLRERDPLLSKIHLPHYPYPTKIIQFPDEANRNPHPNLTRSNLPNKDQMKEFKPSYNAIILEKLPSTTFFFLDHLIEEEGNEELIEYLISLSIEADNASTLHGNSLLISRLLARNSSISTSKLSWRTSINRSNLYA